MSAWKPIETAPKDGTSVLVWFYGEPHVAVYAPIWTPENKRWFVRHPKWPDSSSWSQVTEIEPNQFQVMAGLVGPTHWMPLPEPPK